jgi:hypothetical protein
MQRRNRYLIAVAVGMGLIMLAVLSLSFQESATVVAEVPSGESRASEGNMLMRIGALTETTAFTVYIPVVYNNCYTYRFDDFSDSTSGWPVGEASFGSSYYTGGEYRLVNDQVWMYFAGVSPDWIVPNDVIVKVEGRIDEGQSALGNWPSIGLVFGLTTYPFSGDLLWLNWYEFRVSPKNQYYALKKYSSMGDTIRTVHSGNSPAIIPNLSAMQALKVRRSGNEITMIVNGTELATVVDDDDAYAGRLSVGLGAGDFYTATFDNFEVRSAGCIVP